MLPSRNSISSVDVAGSYPTDRRLDDDTLVRFIFYGGCDWGFYFCQRPRSPTSYRWHGGCAKGGVEMKPRQPSQPTCQRVGVRCIALLAILFLGESINGGLKTPNCRLSLINPCFLTFETGKQLSKHCMVFGKYGGLWMLPHIIGHVAKSYCNRMYCLFAHK
jgi:hypothetical protein